MPEQGEAGVEDGHGLAPGLNAVGEDGGLVATDEAIDLIGSRTGVPDEVLKMAIGSGRLRLKHIPMSDPAGRKSILSSAEFLQRAGSLPRALDEGFFAI